MSNVAFAGPIDVLALNSGSSSVKFAAYRVGDGEPELLLAGETGAIDRRNDSGHLIDEMGQRLVVAGIRPQAIGHRVVHGGAALRHHCLIDDGVMARLQSAVAFAPLHAAPALALIDAARQRYPELPQVACFDTSFHATMPLVATTLPVAKELRPEGIQRYGFHGLSCESIVRQLGRHLPPRVVIAHLGNGCSITAVRDGRSIDTSMGLTPSGGVIMGTRSGDVDPGLLIYLMRATDDDAAALEALIDHHSGLVGISGLASDMRTLHEAAVTNDDARLAIAMFAISVRKEIAAMASVLGGLDMLVFTGGIGEHDWRIRVMICDNLAWLGVMLDDVRNRAAASVISSGDSPVAVQALPSLENEQIARHTRGLLP